MKRQAYFSSDNIHIKSRRMLDQLKGIGLPQHILTLKKSNSALLVLDMQNYFLDPGSHAFIPSAPILMPGIQLLIREFKNLNRPIIFTRHVNEYDSAGMMSTWWKSLIEIGSENSIISPELETTDGVIIQKQRYDAFWKTDLEEYLHANHVRQLVISGVMTNLCCETTARSAFVRDFEVIFIVDGTATYHEDLHYASIANLAHGFATPILCEDWLHG